MDGEEEEHIWSFLCSACNGVEVETVTKKDNIEVSYLPNTSQKTTNIYYISQLVRPL